MSSSSVGALVFFAGCAVVGLLFRVAAARSERWRASARRLYSADGQLIVFRNAIATVPLWAPASLMLSAAVEVPRPWGAWLSVPALGLVGAACWAAYRVPTPLLPGWLRVEIDQGSTPVARPGQWDWVVFWITAPIFVLGILSILALIVIFHEAG